MYRRILGEEILTAAKKYAAVVLLGPRQSGKTTLARILFPDFEYLTLETPDVRGLAVSDPRQFFQNHPGSLILDEVQRAPELLSYIQGFLDEPASKRRFVLTGSQNLLLAQTISQSLAGRTRIFVLLPLSQRELVENGLHVADSVEARMFVGGYPRIYNQDLNPTEWLSQYYATYVERDIRALSAIGDLDLFDRFVRLTAGRAGQLLNLASLGADAGVSQPTAKAWLSVLKASYVCFSLQPFFRNFGKRIIKSPKTYFYDTGLLCYLLRINSPEQLLIHPLRGSIFENWVIAERMKQCLNQGVEAPFYFWRDAKGNEVDLIADKGDALAPVEIKSSATYHESFAKGLEYFASLQNVPGGEVIYAGTASFRHKNFTVTSWRDV